MQLDYSYIVKDCVITYLKSGNLIANVLLRSVSDVRPFQTQPSNSTAAL